MLAEKGNFPVSLMALALEVSKSGFYSWLENDYQKTHEDKLDDLIRSIWLESDRRFGHRIIHSILLQNQPDITLYRVLKGMRRLNIKGCTPYTTKRTTIPDKSAKPKPDFIKRDFASPVPTYKLAGDITYLRTGQGWLYLSTVIDLNTRMVVGWSLSDKMTSDLVITSLTRAKQRGYIAENAIFHSDRGSQYTSRTLIAWAQENKVRLSCSRTGNCHDNAVAESFFATLKNEMYYRKSFKTRFEARCAVIEFIESYYNRRRPHSSIDYKIPAEVMEAFFKRTQQVHSMHLNRQSMTRKVA